MKGNTVFKRTCNSSLDLLVYLAVGSLLASEMELAEELNVSRTTVRAVLSALEKNGIIGRDGTRRILRRRPTAADYYPDKQTLSAGAAVERRFMEWMLKGNLAPGQPLNSAELARQFGSSTTTIREQFVQFQRLGLIERKSSGAWFFKGVTPEFVADIFEVRQMFELCATRSFIALPQNAAPWLELSAIERGHRDILADIDSRYLEFPKLDEQLHRLIHETCMNRFIPDFYSTISIFIHYTFRWNEANEKFRSIVAIHEHLDYIGALQRRDQRLINSSLRKHLRTARSSLTLSVKKANIGE